MSCCLILQDIFYCFVQFHHRNVVLYVLYAILLLSIDYDFACNCAICASQTFKLVESSKKDSDR